MGEFKLNEEAEEDLIRIYKYGIQRFGIIQADKYYTKLYKCFDEITKRPYSFESTNYIKAGYRRCVCGSDSIYFRVMQDRIEIMTIVGRQNLNPGVK